MAIVELYHQRRRAQERSGQEEVYVYDDIPHALRTQLAQIFSCAIGPYHESNGYSPLPSNNNSTWRELIDIMRREMASDRLAPGTPQQEIITYFRCENNVDHVLSVVELICRAIQNVMPRLNSVGATQKPSAAIDEINYRFRQACVGYQFESGRIVRVDSQFLHHKVVKPTLSLLSDARFAGAQEEYLQAHKHYRDGDAKNAVTWAHKAFESSMKAACDIRGWSYEKGARASDLLKVLKANRLWPDYLDTSFDQLLATLASGLPQVRNKAGAHGQGGELIETPDYVAAYALHLAGSKILLISKATLN